MYRSKNLKVIICGGSISGSALAIFLTRIGINVTILERSKNPHVGRGAGIVLPSDSVENFIACDLFDKNIPRLPFSSRSFHVRVSELIKDKKIWSQEPFNGIAFNWSDIYNNLNT